VNDNTTQSAHVILLNIGSVLSVSSISIYIATSFPVGTALGEGSYLNAKKISIVVMVIGFVLGVVVSFGLYLCNDPLARF